MVKSTIQIFCRVKPPRRKQELGLYEVEEAEKGGENLLFLLPKEAAGGYVNNTRDSFKGRFQRIFDVETKQEEIFESVAKPVIENVLSGYNGSIFAYGQTGSGKTFTITGGPEKYADRGIIPRSISHIFREFDKQSQYLFTLHVSYLEIYNNHGYDLLDPRHEISKLEDLPKVTMMEDADHNVHLKNLSVHLANTEEEALNLLFLGDTNRMIAETPMNQASTRSHCIFTVHVTAREHGSATIKKAKLHLVDLAGSERVAKTNVHGKLLDEAKYINASLHCLELVIISLSENKSHIPYRNSMMTNVLKDSLGGNCMTTMIATCSIEKANVEESISTIRFAQRVAMIKNEVTLNEELDPKLIIAKLKREAEELKNQLHLATGGKQSEDPLEEYEIERCRATVKVFLEDTDPDAVVNVGADMRKINECFRIMKTMWKKKNKNVNEASLDHEAKDNSQEQHPYRKENYTGNGEPASSKRGHDVASSSKSSLASDSAAAAAVLGQNSQTRSSISDEHLKKLQDLLLQRDNEIAILVNMLKKEKEKLGGGSKGGSSSSKDVLASSRPSSAASLEDKESAAVTGSRLILGDLSVGRQQAFEIYKRDYADNAKIADQKDKLKANFRTAKELGEKVNASRETINRLKAQIEHYRISLAVSMGMTDGPNPEAPADETETLIRDKLENEKRNYRFAFTQLKELKTEIEHQQHLLEKYRVKLQKDFEAWWAEQCEAAQRQKRLINNHKIEEPETMMRGGGGRGDSLGAKTSWMTPVQNDDAVVATRMNGTHAIPTKGRTKSRTLTPVQSVHAAAPPTLETENTLMSVASASSSIDSAPRSSHSTRSLPIAGPRPVRQQLEPLENRSAPPHHGNVAEKARAAPHHDAVAEKARAAPEKSFADANSQDPSSSASLFTPAFSSPAPHSSFSSQISSNSVQSSVSNTVHDSYSVQTSLTGNVETLSSSSREIPSNPSSQSFAQPKPTQEAAKRPPLPPPPSNAFDIPLTGDPKADADIMAFIKARAKIKAASRDKK